jgi:hypothetical protein
MYQNETESLEKWITAIDSEDQTPGPSPAVIAATLNAVGRHHHQPRWRRIGTIAAAIGLAAGGAGLLWLLSLPARPAVTWGDVIAAIDQAQTKTCRVTSDLDNRPELIGRIFKKSLDLQRTESSEWIVIDNGPAHKRLFLSPRTKTATLLDLTTPSGDQGVSIQTLDQLKNIKESQPIGQQQIDGKPAVGFRITHDGQGSGISYHMVQEIWADSRTHQIVRIDTNVAILSTTDREHPWVLDKWRTTKTHIRLDDFQWNVPLDDSLFSLTPPPGYKLRSGGTVRDEIIK